jgi:PAS domain S-box-containing protein
MVGLRVLVVEDEALIAEDLRDRLARLGCQVVGVVDNGVDAIETAGTTQPGLVLMDIRLKATMDGIEAAREIHSRLDIPCVFLTAHADRATLERAKASSPFGYLLKPFREADLNVVVEMAVARHEQERELKASQALLTSIADGVVATDVDGRVRHLNPAGAALTGWSVEQARGRPVHEVVTLVDEMTGAPMANPLLWVLDTKRPERLPRGVAIVGRDCERRPVDGSVAPVLGRVGQLLGAVAALRDLSAQRRAERDLQDLLKLAPDANVIVDEASDGIFTTDADWRVQRVNRAGCALLGYEEAELARMGFADVVAAHEAPRIALELARLAAAGSVRSEWQFRRKDGGLFFGEVHARRLADGRIIAFLRDVSERHRYETELNEARGFLQLVLDTSPSMISVVDRDGRLRFANRAAASFHGATVEELLGRPPTPAGGDADEVLRTGHKVEREEARAAPGGEPHWFHTIQVPLVRPHGEVQVLGIATDVTDRRRAEEELAASAARYRAIVESSFDGLIVIDAAGRVVEFNRAAERTFGYRREDAVGRRLADLIVPEHLRAAHTAGLERYVATRVGTVIGRPIEMPAVRADGTQLRVEVSVTPVAGTEPPIFAGVVRDVTQRVELEARLRQSQKLQALGQLAGGVAHDFNNVLTVITTNCEVLRGDPPAPTGRELVAEIREAAERATLLTRQLLLFGRRAVLQPAVLDLNEVLAGTSKMLRRLIGENVALSIRPGRGLRMIEIDLGQIEQVVINLALNARDAMPTAGELSIETHNVVLDEELCRGKACRPGPFVQLSVTDTGTGMSPEVLARIFEPFFTTKGAGGTGLGLATVCTIVEDNGGTIAVSSAVGRGSTFNVFLPAVAASAAAQPIAEPSPPRGRGETVLLVEDEGPVRDATRRALEHYGYRVLAASEADEALRLSLEHRGDIDLLVTDVVMPALGGRGLAERLRALRPTLRVLYISGYNEEYVARHGVVPASDAYLQKPFTRHLLARRVRDVLDVR